jgi:hypothetical protein
MTGLLRTVFAVQGTLYVLTGLWPLLHMASFEAVTGPKTDDWLVHTVGLLLAVIGTVLLGACRRHSDDRLFILLAAGTALVLAAVDVFYVARGAISSIYLFDAAIELAFASILSAGWLRSARSEARQRTPSAA